MKKILLNQKNITRKFDLTSIGNALIDVYITVNNSIMKNMNLVLGSMNLINKNKAEELDKLNFDIKFCGGSAANTAVGISSLGGKVNFIGKIGKDEEGLFFSNEMERNNVAFSTNPTDSGSNTGKSYILISSEEKERTMQTYLGASAELNENDIRESDIINSKILFVEAYLLDEIKSKEAVLKALQIAKKHKVKIALTLSDSFCIKRHQEELESLIKDKVDILFANKKEACALFKVETIEEAIEEAKNNCNLSVFTLGSKGAVIIYEKNVHFIESAKAETVVDTTGAGDLYAAGVLFGLINELKIIDCGQIGNIASSKNIEHLGARPNVNLEKLLANFFLEENNPFIPHIFMKKNIFEDKLCLALKFIP